MVSKLIFISDNIESDSSYLEEKGYFEKQSISIVRSLLELEKSDESQIIFIPQQKDTSEFIDEIKRHPLFHISPIFIVNESLQPLENQGFEKRGIFSIHSRKKIHELEDSLKQYKSTALSPQTHYELDRSFGDELGEYVHEMKQIRNQLESNSALNFFRILHTIKGTAKSLQFPQLGEFVHLCEETFFHIQNEKCFKHPIVNEMLLEAIEFLENQSQNILKKNALNKPPPHLIKKMNTFLMINQCGWENLLHQSLLNDKSTDLNKEKESKNAEGFSKNSKSVRVSNEKLDELQEYLKKIIQIRSKLSGVMNHLQSEFPDETFPQVLKSQLENLNQMSMGMMEFFIALRVTSPDHFKKVITHKVQKIANELSKEIEFEFESEENLEIDSAILNSLEKITAHLINNSIDHGIEKKGKLILKISKKSTDHIQVLFKDNGKGIDHDKIRQKIIAKNLLSKEIVNQMSDDKCGEFIFLDGLSTKTEVTELSGRGVGMSAVKDEVVKCGGTIKVESEKMNGTTFLINLPRIFKL